MAELFQYPVQAAIDPVTLSEPLRDEIQWWRPLSVPVRRRRTAEAGLFVADAESLGEPEDTRLTWHAPLSRPTLRPHSAAAREPASVIDPETLSAVLRDEIAWFAPLALPDLTPHQVRTGWSETDPGALGAAEDTRLSWYAALSEPVLPPHNRAALEPAATIDTETLAEPLRDEVQWWRDLAVPRLRRPSVAAVPSFTTDPTTLADAALEVVTLDELAPLSLPVRPRHSTAALGPASIDDPEGRGDPEDTRLTWFGPLSEPVRAAHQTRPGTITIDPVALAQAIQDSLDWFVPLDGPVTIDRLAHLIASGGVAVETVEIPPSTDTSFEWFAELSQPTRPQPRTPMPGAFQEVSPVTFASGVLDTWWPAGRGVTWEPIPRSTTWQPLGGGRTWQQ